jgi:Xaa-Pro aminopeptidase
MQGLDYLKELTRSPIPKELAFSVDEYQGRVAKVRAEMETSGLDALLITFLPNLYYLAGYNTYAVARPACLLLPLHGPLKIHIASMEIPAALLTGWVEDIDVHDWNELGGLADRLASSVKSLGLENKRIGLEFKRPSLSIDFCDTLRRVLPGAQFEDASDLLFRVRLIKSPTELQYIRQAARITLAGIRASFETIAPGKTDNDVARAGYDGMIKAGSEYLSSVPTVTTGHRSGWSHTTFKRFPLKIGDTVFLEYGGCYQRYTATLMRTAVIGNPSPEVRRIADTAKETVRLIIENVKPGRTGDDVARAARGGHASVNSEVYFQEVYGESVGLGFPPTAVEGLRLIAPGFLQVLEPGMTFHLPVALRVPGKFCVGLSEMIAVTETGCEVLTEEKRDLVVIPA